MSTTKSFPKFAFGSSEIDDGFSKVFCPFVWKPRDAKSKSAMRRSAKAQKKMARKLARAAFKRHLASCVENEPKFQNSEVGSFEISNLGDGELREAEKKILKIPFLSLAIASIL